MGAIKFSVFESDSWNLRVQPDDDYAAAERGWGEGSASALQALHQFEQRRESVCPAAE